MNWRDRQKLAAAGWNILFLRRYQDTETTSIYIYSMEGINRHSMHPTKEDAELEYERLYQDPMTIGDR